MDAKSRLQCCLESFVWCRYTSNLPIRRQPLVVKVPGGIFYRSIHVPEKMNFIKVITFPCMTSSFQKGIYSELCVGENTVNVAAIFFCFTLKTPDLLFLS